MDVATRRAANVALAGLAQSGSPVVTTETIDEMVRIGWRRWTSYQRRKHARGADADARVEDLAKGLRDSFEVDRRLVGPLMEDYRLLARTLADAFESVATERQAE